MGIAPQKGQLVESLNGRVGKAATGALLRICPSPTNRPINQFLNQQKRRAAFRWKGARLFSL
jgi:hypothetical protein